MKTLLTILLLAISVFAVPDNHCENMYKKFIKVIPDQTTTVCRATGFGEDRTDVLGFFFNFEIEGRTYKAVFLYGSDFDEMLYAEPSDLIASQTTCLEGSGFRKIKTKMTSSQIANKLLSHKECEEGFELRHLPMTTSQWSL